MISSLANQSIYLLHWDTVVDGEVGFFLESNGNIHEYAYVAGEGNLYHFQVDSCLQQKVADFIEGAYTISSQRIDSKSTLDFFAGQLFFHADALKCEGGNVACGKRCLPKGQVCRQKGGLAKGAAIASGGAVGLAALGAGALLAKTEKGKTAATEAGQLAKQGKVGAAGRSLVRGVQEGGEEAVIKGAEKAGRYVGEKAAKAVTERKKSTPSSNPRPEGLTSKAAKSFAKGAKEAVTEEVKSAATKKAQSIKDKIREIATKDIAYLPGERKLREKIKEATRKGKN